MSPGIGEDYDAPPLGVAESDWVTERAGFYIQTGCALENPYGIPARTIARMLREQSATFVAQVVFGKLVPDDGRVFGYELAKGLFAGYEGQPILGSVWIEEEAAAEAAELRDTLAERRVLGGTGRFVGGADLARKKDATVIFVLDLQGVPERPARLVYYRRIERVPWELVYAEIGRACWLFDAELLLDSTGVGDVVFDAVESRAYCHAHHVANEPFRHCIDHRGDTLGCDAREYHQIAVDRFVFSSPTKIRLMLNLADVLGHGFDARQPQKPYGLIRAPRIPSLAEQMAVYRWDDKKLETDELMALALAAWHGLREMTGPPALGALT